MNDSELLASVFGGETHALREACAAWIASSRLFRDFLIENAPKVRKKARQAPDAESLRDLRLELSAAYHLLLADRRVALTYERFLAEKQRGPDFTVTFKGHIVFNVEVRRLRAPVTVGKLAGAISEKLRQLPPSASNVVLIGLDTSAPADLDGAATMRTLIQRAEAREARHDAFFVERGFRDGRDFLRALQRLSALLLSIEQPGAPATPSATLWLNPRAKHPLPAEAQRLLRDLTL